MTTESLTMKIDSYSQRLGGPKASLCELSTRYHSDSQRPNQLNLILVLNSGDSLNLSSSRSVNKTKRSGASLPPWPIEESPRLRKAKE
ncbi:hypothetical protein DY000_02032960 [Brassica cretica]|uniref:Uncharacterized protein n=1 Tax=Brassica cretica TaxID=69181 RepID=A0ABQ7DRU7_BRACR|nr:hypothetical protein DY000_02032960 [Brassica cretica]